MRLILAGCNVYFYLQTVSQSFTNVPVINNYTQNEAA